LKMTVNPKVSVIMAAYNAGRFVGDAINSLRQQSFPDFELIVVNDGSSDSTAAIIAGHASEDPRIRALDQPNAGLAGARNSALQLARGAFVAIADADDIQLPDRLRILLEKFEADPNLDICGGGLESWSGGMEAGTLHLMPLSNPRIRGGMPFESMMFDPTAMYRRTLLAPPICGYNVEFRMAVDYDLWSRLLSRARFANCPQVLTRYRRHSNQVTEIEAKTGRSLAERRRIWTRIYVELFQVKPTEEQLQANEKVATWPSSVKVTERNQIGLWLETLLRANRTTEALPQLEFGEQVGRRWLWTCSHATGDGLKALLAYWRSPLSRLPGATLRSRLGLIRNCFRARSKSTLPAR
jgi:glycosyltransferase involved in cell wall biosynthesis